MTDIVILIFLICLIITYIIVVINRKKKEKEMSVEPAVIEKLKAETELEILKKQHFIDKMKEKTNRDVESHLVDYSVYRLTFKEYLFYAVIAGMVFFLIGYLFYESIIFSFIISGLGLIFPKFQKKKLLEQRKEKLTVQFKEAIGSLSSSLAAGRSIENSLKEVVTDLYLLYPDPNTYIIREFEIINRRIENGDTVENAIRDFSVRSDIDDIINFANVFITCKRTGGNLVEVIRRTSDIISEKIDIQQEVSVMMAQKKFESRILSVAPLGMILLLKYAAGDYLSPMYQWSSNGPIVMTVCLVILVFSYWLSQKIMNIKV
ncbi:type II secretion system F family protein [Ornithinibacillus sp. BX22]|uniref:Type II secretion system F family protein n=3 Tax=Bacillaceae TaxID=186817 RepID=A0A923L6J4_9BACI|nr:type II secretion system F family protein [Ornithinibacillus hominis]MBS3680362.1 type II secretion system F family protein [Ornithinibacillus massiliensis]